MRQVDKKRVKEIHSRLSELQTMLIELAEEHQEWIDERNADTDDRFESTATGERAYDEQCTFEEWTGSVETMCEEIEELLNI